MCCVSQFNERELGMQRLTDIEIDREFQLHTSYHNDFFLLRTKVLVDGKSTEVKSVKEGSYEGPVLKVCHSGSTTCKKLWVIANAISPILIRCGVYHVDTFYYEQSPLFHTVFTSESCLKNFLLAMGEMKSALETQLRSLLSRDLKSIQCHVPEAESPQQLTIDVQPELFLVSPNQLNPKGAELHLVTAQNYSTLLTHWKSSKLFEFASLYQEEAKPPQIMLQPTSRKDVSSGKPTTFTIEAIGSDLNYQWQWKPAGKGVEQNEWQNLTLDDSTFQEVEAGLKVTSVQPCNAGYYRCVVSNSVGSETSQSASLSVAPEFADLVKELQDVNDWLTFGINLGIRMPKLEVIRSDYPTTGERRTQMLNEWHKNVAPTWSAVVKALVGIGMRRLASELAQKHAIDPPKLPDDEPMEQMTNFTQQEEATGSKLFSEVQKCRGNLQEERRELKDTEQQLTHSQNSKIAVNEKVCQIISRIEELRKNVRKIAQEKKIIEIELQSKERECQLLSEINKRDEAYSTLLEEKINRNMEDIEKLEKELKTRESDLESAHQETQVRQEGLSQARAELKRKDEEVQNMQQEYEKLTSRYDIGMEQLSKLIQLMAADKEEMQQQLVDMKVESESKSHQIEACNLNIRQLTEEVETLSNSLEKKEARAAQVQRELKQASSTSEQLLESLMLTAQITNLEQRLQVSQHQKQQAESEREAAVQGVEAMQTFLKMLQVKLDESPKVTDHPESQTEVCPGESASFIVQAAGTEPQWQRNPAGSKEWQPCDVEGSDGAKVTIPSVLKSDEGSYHCVVNNDAGTQISKPAKLETCPQRELQTPLKLGWRNGRDISWEMSLYPKTVQLHNNLYVGGGGSTSTSLSEDCAILVYDTASDCWSKLPEYHCYRFGMTAVNGRLTLVGGRYRGTYNDSNQLGVFDPSSQQWTKPYPPMITPRSAPEVATYNNYLLVAGGEGNGHRKLTTVEVLDVGTSKQWLSTTQLPVPCYLKTSAILHDNWYVITASKQVMYASLRELSTIPQTVTESATNTTTAQWCTLPNSPLKLSTAIALCGSLLTVGGLHGNTASTAIHLYHPETNTWTKVGDLPTPRYYCSATLLPSGELLVSGGRDQQHELTTLVDIATLLD